MSLSLRFVVSDFRSQNFESIVTDIHKLSKANTILDADRYRDVFGYLDTVLDRVRVSMQEGILLARSNPCAQGIYVMRAFFSLCLILKYFF